jgi:integrase
MATKKIRGIYLRGNVYWFTHGSGKRRMQVSLETGDYTEAVGKAQELIDNPLLNTTTGFKVDLDAFADFQTASNIWTKKSRKSKYSVLMMFGEDLGFPSLPKITTAEIQNWYDKQIKRIKVVSVNPYITVIKAFFNWALTERKIVRNPADGVKLTKVEEASRERFCTFKQRDEIIRKAPTDELRFILYAGFFSGYRKNEIVEARPDWFDMDLKHIHVKRTETFLAKDKEERTIPMAEEFYTFLKRYGKKGTFMIAPDVVHGKGDYRYDFRKPFTEYMASIGYEWVTPHIMRHSFASLLAIKGCSLFKIAQWLGDTLATTEKHYAHLLPTDPDIEMLNGNGSSKTRRTKKSTSR